MGNGSWTYFTLLGLSLLYPLAQSFEKRVYMHRKFQFILPGLLVTGSVYILWDIWFTKAGIWGFNHNFTRDFYLLGLPVEEWLFFMVVPYCCIFLYEVLRYFVKRFYHPDFSRVLIYVLLVLLIGSLPFVRHRTYTFTAFAFTSFMLILQLYQKTYKTWFSGFILTYLVSLIPFLVVNGVLTSIPVVWYDNAENLGIRIYTVPLEDFIYLMGLLLPSVNIYQLLLYRYASPGLRSRMGLERVTGF
ncbi:MAG TPA: lycopene cyclase domain-containing protein [Bacteroides sp.]|nr:lycopene cyclase domain-containing protein [Bacteroides sp.]